MLDRGDAVAEARDSAKSAGEDRGIAAPTEGAGAPGVRGTLARAWPIPVLVISAGVLGAGLWTAFSQRPKEDASLPLKHAEQLVESGEYQSAIDELNGAALGFMDSGAATHAQEQRFYLARARAFAGAQAKMGISRSENHERIIADYRRAEELGGGEGHGEGLTPTDVSNLVESLIAMGSVDESLRRIASLGDGAGHGGEEQRARKLRLTKLLIERNLGASKPEDRREDLTLDLLARMSTDPDLPPDDRGWVLVRQSELLLSLHRVEDAITKLLRELQRMSDVPAPRQGELYVLLGKAYVELGQDQNAMKQLANAERLLGEDGGEARAEASLLLGRLAQRSPDPSAHEAARERYSLVLNEYKSSRAYLPALLGTAEIDADAGEVDRSIERYEQLVHAQHDAKVPPPPEAGVPAVLASLMDRWLVASDSGKHAEALRFAQVAEGLYRGSHEAETPPELLLALGRTHRTLADEVMDAARQDNAPDFTVRDLDPATQAEVKRHYLAAGDYFRRHAERISSESTAAFASSLWTAADSFDLAGDLEEAGKAFGAYIDGSADTDPNRSAARFRLAQILQAQGDYKAALSLYEWLRSGTGDDRQPASAGNWSDRSIVPMALCYLADGDPANDVNAESLLSGVVNGQLLGPEARDYRDSLVELGNMYYAAGRHADAIGRFEEVLDRYAPKPGETPSAERQMPTLSEAKLTAIRFKLADSHRLEAGKIAKTLQGAIPQTVENELKAARVEHLTTAIRLYEQVRAELEDMDSSEAEASAAARRLTDLERTFLRNASFYIGDCAFDLGDYSRAIAAYDAAALKYVDDPSSLVAMVQIVNAYVAQGQLEQARTANDRARRQLARFSDDVWNRPDLPMEKKHWERWLESRQSLEPTAAAGGG